MNKVIVVTGQTATGKTRLALTYAAHNNGELINCDARQIYKYLDIVTGKDLTDHTFYPVDISLPFSVGYYRLEDTNIWLYDIAEPSQYFSSHAYARLASNVVARVLAAGKTPIIIGGSYFYLKHLLYGDSFSEKSHDPILRNQLSAMTLEELSSYLIKLNPAMYESMNNSDRNNSRRLIRRIERVMSGTTRDVFENGYTYTLEKKLGHDALDIEYIGLRHEHREQLTDTIIKRVDNRLKEGAIEEVQRLIEKGYTLSDPGMKTIGCLQLYKHLREGMSLEKARNEWILREVQYAKRQYTFMKQDPHIEWRITA
ncbi:MAG: tRNA delta(2)-isopentenylpyrophosphate transferase, tRNA dimethylallyltransferase [Candidatus Parcubacteria bacterium]|jgi:tRNA dimethylallyltransferase